VAAEAVATVSRRAAVITDVHGNVPALAAALRRIDELGLEDVYCGGDLVGYGPRPNEICRTIQERGIATIYGNYDYAIARDLDDCGCFYLTPKDREIGQGSVAWTLVHTDERSKQFMRDLPFDLRFEFGGRRVRVVHGSPRKVNEYLLEERPASSFERIARLADCDVLLFGHTHKPWVHEYGGVLFVNCGSVGKPKDGDPRGSFVVLAEADGGVAVSVERVEYDASAVAREIRNVGLPDELADQLVQGA
jgi:putative phosphoesterase